MSIKMQFAPDLVLRSFSEYEKNKKKQDECFPQELEEGLVYKFLKNGQRAYWLEGEQPLLEKSEDGVVSAPKASVIILEVTHFFSEGKVFSRGLYKVVKCLKEGEVYSHDQNTPRLLSPGMNGHPY